MILVKYHMSNKYIHHLSLLIAKPKKCISLIIITISMASAAHYIKPLSIEIGMASSSYIKRKV